MVTREDVWEIKALLSKILEKCDEVQEKFRASLDYLESSVEETGFEDPGINNENQEYNLQLGSEEATNAEPDDSARNSECSERLVITQPSASKTINCEDAEMGNGVANEKLQIECAQSIDVESNYWANSKDCLDKVVVSKNHSVSNSHHSLLPRHRSNRKFDNSKKGVPRQKIKNPEQCMCQNKAQISVMVICTFRTCDDRTIKIWDPGRGLIYMYGQLRFTDFACKVLDKITDAHLMASNARATGLIALFVKGDVLSSIFWLLVDTIWDPGGNYLNFAPNATSKVATPTKNVLGKMNEASHFSVEDWQFPFGLLISSPFFLKSFYISAYKVFGESSDPSLAIQIATVTSCAEYGVAACVFPYSYHDEACTGFEVGVHSLLEYEPREVPRIVLHVSLASNIPILLGYNPSWSDYLTTVNQLLFSQNVLPRCCLVAAMKDQNMKWVDKEGKTQLIVACMAPERSILAKTLIELVAKVNAYRPGLHAGTPLHHAAKRGLDHTVGLLLSHGANLLVRNDDGQTPLNVARSRGFVNVVRAIESHICFFSGWLREFYGPGFLEAFAPQLLSRKIWAVIVPCGSHNPLKPLKLELAIYSSLQEAQPRTVFLRLILTNSVSEDAT